MTRLTTPNPRDAWELQCFGCSEADLRENVESSFMFGAMGAAKFAVSILSDAQEEIASGSAERARQSINRAKWVIAEYLDRPRA